LPRNGPSGTYYHAEQVVGGLVDRHPRAQLGGPAHDVAELGLDVESDARSEDGCGVGRPLALPGRSHHVGAGHDDGARATVVADRQVLPVGRESGVVRPEDLPDVARVVLARVEVHVVGDLDGQVQGDVVHRVEVR